MLEERVFEPDGSFRVLGRLASRRARKRSARGRRLRQQVAPDSGRYVKARIPCGRIRSLALDATLRAAAPHQVHRKSQTPGDGSKLRICPADLREKVLSRPSGVSVLFAVDASGSMGVEEVMAKAKGIVVSLLADAYQKRDRVGLLAFRGTEARLILPFTTSVEQAHKRLKSIPTGGKSPVALALAKSLELFTQEARKSPGSTPLLVLLTDARANISMEGGEPFGEALHYARRIRESKIRALVVDTDPTWIHSYAYARVLAQTMGAKCLRLGSLEVSGIIDFMNLESR